MKLLLVLSSVIVAIFAAENVERMGESCSYAANKGCRETEDVYRLDDVLRNCNAKYSEFEKNVEQLQKYANHQIQKSFEYLLLSTNFGTYVKNRPGFEKQFRALSDKSWGYGIDLIKHITKRGGKHNFDITSNSVTTKTLDINEMSALALTLDYEKDLAKEAHTIYENFAHHKHQKENHSAVFDPEIAHYIEENFIEDQANTVRKLSGYANDLKKMLQGATDISLALYMFDEYLAKQ